MKILFSYFIIGIVIFSTFSYVLHQTYSKKILDETNETTKSMVYQSYNTADTLLTHTFYNFYQLFNSSIDTDITKAIYSPNLNQFDIDKIIKKLNQQTMSNPLIRSIYIYNLKSDKVMFHHTVLGGGALSPAEFYDQDVISMLDNPGKIKIMRYFARNTQFTYKDTNYTENLVTLIFTFKIPDKKPEQALIINMDQNKLQQILTSGKVGELNQVFIIDKEGHMITHSDPEMLNKYIMNLDYIQKILQTDSQSGFFEYKINNEDSLVSYVKADSFQWVFVGIGTYSQLLSSANSIQKTILIITFTFIFMGVLIATFFATIIYGPIRTLLQDIKERYYKDSGQDDEFKYLKNIFHELIESVDRYKADAKQLQNEKKKAFLQKLVKGEFDNTMFSLSKLNEYGIDFSYQYYVIVILKIDAYDIIFRRKWSNDPSLLKFALLNVSCEILSEQQYAEGVDIGDDYVVLILNVKNNNSDQTNSIIDNIRRLQKSLKDYLHCTVTAGIGSYVRDLSQLNFSYNKALSAVKHRIIFGHSSVIPFTMIEDRIRTPHEYPIQLERNIINSIRQNNIKALKSHIEEFFGTIITFSADEILMFIIQLMTAIVKITHQLKFNNFDSRKYDFKTVIGKSESFETITELKTYVISLCSEIIKISKEDLNYEKMVIINRIKEYIHNHYTEQNISTDSISDMIGFSCNYTRTLFKKLTGISITEYINQCRMMKAKNLLRETDLTVKKISELVGYPDESKYFYVVFKKYFGITPDEYRTRSTLSKAE